MNAHLKIKVFLTSKYPFPFSKPKENLITRLKLKLILNATITGYASSSPFNLHESISLYPQYQLYSKPRSGMQGVANTLRLHGRRVKLALLQQMRANERFSWSNLFSNSSAPIIPHKGLENTTVAELLKIKGDDEASPLHWCRTNDTVYDAVKHMTQNNIGALVVVKPGDENLVAGIVTERDYLRKIIVQGRSSKDTKVGEIMTDENKLVAVSSDTNILQAMQLMTDKHIRHVPVIDRKVVGMISIVDVVRAVVEQQNEEVKRLSGYIKGDYY